jgi:Plasmid encoded RepA protein
MAAMTPKPPALRLIKENREPRDKTFTAKPLVLATLPHSDPGNLPAWKRVNGDYALIIRPGWDARTDQPIGYPYGVIPRLLLFWIVSEAVRTRSRRLELGPNLNQFLRAIGLSPATGRGKRGDAKRVREQMDRLFQASISFQYANPGAKSWLNINIAPQGCFWWDPQDQVQQTLWSSWVQLSEEFFNAITQQPFPIDTKAIAALRRSPLALDLYAWCAQRSFVATKQNRPSRCITWQMLAEQFGGDYAHRQHFRAAVKRALGQVKAVYPGLNVECVRGGLRIHPGATAVPELVDAVIEIEPEEPEPDRSASGKVSPAGGVPPFEAEVFEQARAENPGWDIYRFERQWRSTWDGKAPPRHPQRAFLAWLRAVTKGKRPA